MYIPYIYIYIYLYICNIYTANLTSTFLLSFSLNQVVLPWLHPPPWMVTCRQSTMTGNLAYTVRDLSWRRSVFLRGGYTPEIQYGYPKWRHVWSRQYLFQAIGALYGLSHSSPPLHTLAETGYENKIFQTLFLTPMKMFSKSNHHTTNLNCPHPDKPGMFWVGSISG